MFYFRSILFHSYSGVTDCAILSCPFASLLSLASLAWPFYILRSLFTTYSCIGIRPIQILSHAGRHGRHGKQHGFLHRIPIVPADVSKTFSRQVCGARCTVHRFLKTVEATAVIFVLCHPPKRCARFSNARVSRKRLHLVSFCPLFSKQLCKPFPTQLCVSWCTTTVHRYPTLVKTTFPSFPQFSKQLHRVSHLPVLLLSLPPLSLIQAFHLPLQLTQQRNPLRYQHSTLGTTLYSCHCFIRHHR